MRIKRKQSTNVYDATTDDGLIKFAEKFVEDRLKGFRKDIDICLTPNCNNNHAYMPALMTCFSLLELFSGLYTGTLKDNDFHKHIIKYIKDFVPNRYDDYELKAAYIAFRHKLAHYGHPYYVLNTQKDPRLSAKEMLLAWMISEQRLKKPIRIKPCKVLQKIKRNPTPWPVCYDHRMEISIPALADDADGAARKYLAALKKDQ